MNKKIFTISTNDIKKLQKSIPIVTKKNYNGEDYQGPEYIITDNGSPYDFIATAFDQSTYNEYDENNQDYVNENEKAIVNDLSFFKAFLKTLTNEQRVAYSEDTDKYDCDLEAWTEERKNYFNENGTWDNDLLEEEYSKKIKEFYHQFAYEFYYGDYRESGALERLNKAADGMFKLEYDRDKDVVTIDQTDVEEEHIETKESFLNWMLLKYKAVIDVRRNRSEARRKEIEELQKRKASHEEWEKEQKKKMILDFND